MPTLDQIAPISLRLYKTLASNPGIVWANTYEFDQELAHEAIDYQNLVNAMANTEATIHADNVRIIRGVVSTWVPDGQPYNPLSFISFPLNIAGQRSTAGSEPEPLQMCLRVQFNVQYGRQGFRLYRGCLLESDVHSPAGTPALTDPSLGGTFANFLTGIQDEVNGTSGFQLALVSTGNIRFVSVVTVGGVTVKKFNNRYFDRTNA